MKLGIWWYGMYSQKEKSKTKNSIQWEFTSRRIKHKLQLLFSPWFSSHITCTLYFKTTSDQILSKPEQHLCLFPVNLQSCYQGLNIQTLLHKMFDKRKSLFVTNLSWCNFPHTHLCTLAHTNSVSFWKAKAEWSGFTHQVWNAQCLWICNPVWL